MSVPDRIEKQVILRAPIERVWRALSDAREFGAWFGAEFDAPFAEPIIADGKELTTLVVFELRAVEGGTQLRITESGFDRIPLAQRAKAFTENEGGWQHQTELIAKYLLRHAA